VTAALTPCRTGRNRDPFGMTEERLLVYTLWYCDYNCLEKTCLVLRPGEQPPPEHESVARVTAKFCAASLAEAAHQVARWLNPWVAPAP
jgi:hypothetical protein